MRTLLRMPRIPNITITKAWRHRNESGRIHYMVTTHDGGERHLYCADDSGLGRLLDAALHAQGYEGPASAAEGVS